MEMTEKEIKERKNYLALQAFYLNVKELIEELESRLKDGREEIYC